MVRGMNSADIKRSNRGLVLRQIALCAETSRVAIARETGLTKMTVGNIVQELVELGLVADAAPVYEKTTGPNPMGLKIAERAGKVVGVYLSRDEIVVSLGDLTGNVLISHRTVFSNETLKSISYKLLSNVKDMLSKAKDNVFAIGVAMIGPIDESGAIVGTPNFFGIERLPVRELLEREFGLPVVVYNDISAAAVAEQMLGGHAFKDFVYIGMANGLGAGVIHNRELLTTDNAFIGEFGHITIDLNGEKCPCGNTGCLELYVSATVLCRRLGKLLGRSVAVEEFSSLADLPECDAVFSDVSKKLAVGMISLANLLGPQAFILGHEAFYFPDKYVKLMEQAVNRVNFLGRKQEISVLKSSFSNKAAMYGSICCVLREIFGGRFLFEE